MSLVVFGFLLASLCIACERVPPKSVLTCDCVAQQDHHAPCWEAHCVVMDDALYDTSLTVYALTESSPAILSLLSASPARLNDHSQTLRDYLSTGRVAYEREEEQEKIGGLRECAFAVLRQEDAEPHGVAISLLYDKIAYKFLLYGNTAGRPQTTDKRGRAGKASEKSLPLLLIKASSSITARFLAFLEQHFNAPAAITLKLSATHLPTAVNDYVTDLVRAHQPIAADHALLDYLSDTLGALKLTISVTDVEAAKSLRTIDLDVPPETLYQLVTDSSSASSFLEILHKHLHARTGLLLPLAPQPPIETEGDGEAPLKLSRISNAAFALSSEGRLKLSAKAAQAVEAIPGLGSGEENVVRRANQALLNGLIDAALKLREAG